MKRSQANGIFWDNSQGKDKKLDMSVESTDTGAAGKISTVVAWVVVWLILLALVTLAAKGVYAWVPFVWNLF